MAWEQPKRPEDRFVAVPCPNCQAPTTFLVYRHFDIVALLCGVCEHTWDVDASEYAILKRIEPRSLHTKEL